MEQNHENNVLLINETRLMWKVSLNSWSSIINLYKDVIVYCLYMVGVTYEEVIIERLDVTSLLF